MIHPFPLLLIHVSYSNLVRFNDETYTQYLDIYILEQLPKFLHFRSLST